ncbi:MAG TPA: hypothetical protein VK737_07840 [Opitutales bacterium]|jgi:hypothetical protein|nr:hypothetical protein [Opitutales bacterium]
MSEDNALPFPAPALAARLRISPKLRELLVAVVTRVQVATAAAPDHAAPPTANPADLPDPELDAAWAAGLRECEENDALTLLGLMTDANFGTANVPLTPVGAEAIARASVRVRLCLRETALREMNSADVEGGIDVYRLPPGEQQSYICFRLLAELEEDLILQLDPGLANS